MHKRKLIAAGAGLAALAMAGPALAQTYQPVSCTEPDTIHVNSGTCIKSSNGVCEQYEGTMTFHLNCSTTNNESPKELSECYGLPMQAQYVSPINSPFSGSTAASMFVEAIGNGTDPLADNQPCEGWWLNTTDGTTQELWTNDATAYPGYGPSDLYGFFDVQEGLPIQEGAFPPNGTNQNYIGGESSIGVCNGEGCSSGNTRSECAAPNSPPTESDILFAYNGGNPKFITFDFYVASDVPPACPVSPNN